MHYKSRMIQVLFAFSLSTFALTANSTPFTIDGNLSDWGILVADGVSGNVVGTDYSALRTDLAGSMVEDTNDTSNSYKVTPYYGGQNYDGEFFGAAVQNNTLYIAILSGQRPDNGSKLFAPGDIRIGTDKGVFGIEIGGGASGSTATTALVGGEAGSTYTLDNHGYTLAETSSSMEAGSVWFGADWVQDPFNNSISTDVQLVDGTGSKAGDASDFIFTLNRDTQTHSVVEVALDLSIFDGATLEEFYWSPSCSNDRLYFDTSIKTVPEPAMLALMGFGFLGLSFARRRVR